MKQILNFINESKKEEFTTTKKYICINTTDYDGGTDDAMVQSFNLNEADNLGLGEDVDTFKNIKVGELVQIKDAYDGVYVMRVCE